MTDVTQDTRRTAGRFLSRTARLLFKPAREFARIAPEPESVRKVTITWVIPWVLIKFAANLVPALIFGNVVKATVNGAPGTIHVSLFAEGVPGLILPLFVMSVAMPFVMALVINAWAGLFGAQRDYVQAVRTAAYTGTPAWLVGVFGPAWEIGVFRVTPPLSIGLFIGALWSVILLFRGLPLMMKCPPRKAVFYTIAVVVVMAVLWLFALKFTFEIASTLYFRSFVPED